MGCTLSVRARQENFPSIDLHFKGLIVKVRTVSGGNMAEYRIIDADGHVMELDSELREFIGAPYKDLEWHQSYSFWPGLTMDGYLRSLRQKGGWAGGGDGPKANHWLEFLDKNKIELTVLYPTQGLTH